MDLVTNVFVKKRASSPVNLANITGGPGTDCNRSHFQYLTSDTLKQHSKKK